MLPFFVMYDVVARYYDVLHQELVEDVPLVLALAKAAGGRVLELGCGTGRLMQSLVEAGLEVVGVDNSAEMLAIAQTKITSPLASFVQADMTTFVLDQQFELIVISHNTMMHLNQVQLASMLKQVQSHLTVNGRLLIDVENPLAMAAMINREEFVPEEPFLDSATGLEVQPFARWFHHVEKQIATVEWRYERADGAVNSAEIHYHYHFPHILQMLLSKNGLNWQTAFGDYDQIPFEENSPRLILIANQS